MFRNFESIIYLFFHSYIFQGYGWPSYKGGPLFYADRILTLPVLFLRLTNLSKKFPNSKYYNISKFLELMIKEKISIIDLQNDKDMFLITYLRNIMKKQKYDKPSMLIKSFL